MIKQEWTDQIYYEYFSGIKDLSSNILIEYSKVLDNANMINSEYNLISTVNYDDLY